MDVTFSTPTTRQVESIMITGGGIIYSMSNIGNSDFKNFQMLVGGGLVDLNFQGSYESDQHNAHITVAGNLLDISVPSDAGERVGILSIGIPIAVRGSGWESALSLFFYQRFITSDYDTQDVKIDMDILSVSSFGILTR